VNLAGLAQLVLPLVIGSASMPITSASRFGVILAGSLEGVSQRRAAL
jgi:hypothetical protein